MFNEREGQLRRRLLRPWPFRLYLVRNVPLALIAGVRVSRFDESGCVATLPSGWRTRNPFRSTYFAAQAMAAELSTGVPALIFAQSAERSTALILRGIQAEFTARLRTRGSFAFCDLGAMRDVVTRAGASGQSEEFAAAVEGTDEQGAVVSRWTVRWSFKRRD